jgi:hypothetical protein
MNDIKVLTALERRPLTVENLSYSLGLPLEETREVVQRLWDEDYIDSTTRTVNSMGGSYGSAIGAAAGGAAGVLLGPIGAAIGAAIGALTGAAISDQFSSGGSEKRFFSDSDTYFILTSKGHYRLHPPTAPNS